MEKLYYVKYTHNITEQIETHTTLVYISFPYF